MYDPKNKLFDDSRNNQIFKLSIFEDDKVIPKNIIFLGIPRL